MRVVVFGATGRTGREVVRQALARGFHVTAFVRETSRLPLAHDNLRLVAGAITNATEIARVIADQRAVISTLGVGTALTHDPVVIDGIRVIARAAEHASVARLLYLSFIGVRDSRDAAGVLLQRLATTVLRHEVADHEVKEAAIAGSFVNWTIVRPPMLTNGRLTASYRIGEDIRAHSLLPMMSRADVADLLLRQISDEAFIRKAVRMLH
jgi:putative NADH-flavin reductase